MLSLLKWFCSLFFYIILIWWSLPVPILIGMMFAFLIWISRRKPSPKFLVFEHGPPVSRCFAHRGAGLDAPENTLSAFKYCIEKGYKHIEFDVRITLDGKCILSNDSVVGGKKILETNWSDLKDIVIGSNHPMSEIMGVTKLSLFDDAINFFILNKINIIIDIKDYDNRLLLKIIDTFKLNPILYDMAIVTSFNPIIIYKLKYMDYHIVSSLNYQPRIFSSLSYRVNGNFHKRFTNPVFHVSARIFDFIYSIIWSLKILPLWTGCSAVILHKDVANLQIIEEWRKRKFAIFLFGVNQPLEKHYVLKVLGVPYITDTLVGEPAPHGEINGKIH